jgi:enamine deaminase RidA (YjgF/YER057c/UK114 family)
MTHTLFNPAGLHDPTPFGYSHTAQVPAGSGLVLISGQYGANPDGSLVSPHFADQVERALHHLTVALAAHGLTLEHVAQLRTYVVGIDFEKLAVLGQAMGERFGGRLPTQTLIGVAGLALPGMLYEVEAVAVQP